LKLDRMMRIDSARNEHRPPGPVRFKQPFFRSSDKKGGVITMVNLLQQRAMDSALRNDKNVVVVRGNQTVDFDSFPPSLPAGIRPHRSGRPGDSIPIDPEAISTVNVNRSSHPGENFITIEYDKKRTRGFMRDSMGFPERGVFGYGGRKDLPPGNAIFRLMLDIDSVAIRDSVSTQEVRSAYAARLKGEGIDIPFSVTRHDSEYLDLPNAVTIGFAKPVTFELSLGSTFGYMMNKLKLP